MSTPHLIGLDWGTTACRAYLIGARLTSAHNLIQVARPRLFALRETIGETSNLAILDNTSPHAVRW